MALEDFTPTLADVGAKIRARTKDTNGNEVGTFNDDTRPTGNQVNSLIADAVGEVASVMATENPCPNKPDIHAAVLAKAKGAASIYAAMLVELSHFPEQVERGSSPYDKLKELWDDRTERLAEFVSEQCGGGGSDAGGSGGMPLARAHFPDEQLAGWRNRW